MILENWFSKSNQVCLKFNSNRYWIKCPNNNHSFRSRNIMTNMIQITNKFILIIT